MEKVRRREVRPGMAKHDCRMITSLLYLMSQGETFSSSEASPFGAWTMMMMNIEF